VVIGGVMTSTVLTLLVLPTLYVVVGKRQEEKKSAPLLAD
jgi:Cu/Ag efflux pump CusA